MSSLGYQWPVSHTLAGSVFIDHLTVGDDFGALSFGDGIWAAGFALKLVGPHTELAELQIVGGSDGYKFLVTVGLSSGSSDHSN